MEPHLNLAPVHHALQSQICVYAMEDEIDFGFVTVSDESERVAVHQDALPLPVKDSSICCTPSRFLSKIARRQRCCVSPSTARADRRQLYVKHVRGDPEDHWSHRPKCGGLWKFVEGSKPRQEQHVENLRAQGVQSEIGKTAAECNSS